MRTKIEKTEHGKVKAVGLKRKKVTYGKVEERAELYKNEGEYSGPEGKLTPIEPKMTHEGGENGGEVESTAQPISTQSEPISAQPEEISSSKSILDEILKSMEEDLKKTREKEEKAKEDSKKSPEEQEASKQEEQKQEQEERSKKQKNDFLTEYLVMQLRLRALAEILGAVKVAEGEKTYYSFSAIEHVGVEVTRLTPAKGLILDFDIFPWFDSEEKAQAFLELCHEIINRYCHLMSELNPLAVVSKGDIEVIHS